MHSIGCGLDVGLIKKKMKDGREISEKQIVSNEVARLVDEAIIFAVQVGERSLSRTLSDRLGLNWKYVNIF